MTDLKLAKEFFQIVDTEKFSISQILSDLSNLGQFIFPHLYQFPLFLFLSKSHLIVTHKIPLNSIQFALPFSYNLRVCDIVDNTNPQCIKRGFNLEKTQNNSIQFYVHASQFSFEQIMKKISTCIRIKGFHDQFNAKRRIGNGNFAKVYQAIRLKDNKKFAVKAFSKKSILSSPKGRQIFQQQFFILKNLKHPNIVKIESLHQSNNSIYVAIQLIHGSTVIKFLNQKKHFDLNQISGFLRSLIKTLSYLNNKGIAHRDLKPQNIILRNNSLFDPVIIDFGLAIQCQKIPYLLHQCGTPGYVSPQIFNSSKDQKITPISDIFSVGAIFYILLTKKPLFFSQQSEEELFIPAQKKILKLNKEFDYQINQDEINQTALDLLKKMLQQNPSKRITHQQILQHPFFNEKLQSQITISIQN